LTRPRRGARADRSREGVLRACCRSHTDRLRAGDGPRRGCVRASPHFYNDEAELEALLEALEG